MAVSHLRIRRASVLLAVSTFACACGNSGRSGAVVADAGSSDATRAPIPGTDSGVGADALARIDAPSDAATDTLSMADAIPRDAAPQDDGAICTEVNAFVPDYADLVNTWIAEDALGGWPAAPVVFTGSSSIRRWRDLARDYTDYTPIQRGFGGAQLAEVAYFAQDLIIQHAPRAVVVYAGTDDLADGVPADIVINRFRCLRYRIGMGLGFTVPVLFVAITPNPSRWAELADQTAVNSAVAAIANADPAVIYVDVATPFLAMGSPPPLSLFDSDQLHLSPSGYALWNSIIRPAVVAATPPDPPAGPASPALPSGTRILVDLGPDDPGDGELSPSPDYLGQDWNNWRPVDAGVNVVAGEQIVNLQTVDGGATGVALTISGGFLGAGRDHGGGLEWPSQALLGDLAVGSATGDYFYSTGDDVPGGLELRNLDPSRTYTLKLFAGLTSSQVQTTGFTVYGASEEADASVQVSGPGAGADGGDVNDHVVVTFTGLRPDAWGHLFLNLSIDTGTNSYLSLFELDVE
jgi:hypothetical protein